MKCLLTFECSNNALLPYDGNRVFQASGALTCSWVIAVPGNYSVKLTIKQKNVDSIGNTNCNNDYLQIRDGADSSGTLLAKLWNSYPGPSVFRSTGTHLWVEYKSTQASNSFEATFKGLLDSSFCPTNIISNGTPGSLSSPSYPNNFPNDMECSWNITGPARSRVILLFHRICLGICPNAMSQDLCRCDSLSISNVLESRQLCLGSQVIPFISLQNIISFSMVTDEQGTSKGFTAEYQSVYLDGACSQMIQLTNMSGWFSSPTYPSHYPGNMQCGWNISIPSGYKIFLTFLEFELEKCGGETCTCDYVMVNRVKSGFSEKKCGTKASGEWTVRNEYNDNIVVTFKSDSQGNGKGFEAVYTLIPVDAWESVPSAFCPWTDTTTSPTKEPDEHRDHEDITTDSIEIAVAQTAVREDSSSADATNSATGGERNSVEKRESSLSSLFAICALSLLCIPV